MHYAAPAVLGAYLGSPVCAAMPALPADSCCRECVGRVGRVPSGWVCNTLLFSGYGVRAGGVVREGVTIQGWQVACPVAPPGATLITRVAPFLRARGQVVCTEEQAVEQRDAPDKVRAGHENRGPCR